MNTRQRAKRIVVFNHKGGVGKTTLTVNLAIAIAEQGKRVLLVDSDPQCNLTSHLVAEDVVDDLLDHSDDESGATVWSGLKPLVEASGDINFIAPIEIRDGKIFLLPGDIRLSEFEADLPDFWAQSSLRKPKGFRGTTAFSRLINDVAQEVDADYVFYDIGPNIGHLNRVVLLDCDYFIVPAACDLFSIRALKTLGNSLSTWITEWSHIVNLSPEEQYLLPGHPQFLGYIPGGFRTYRGAPAKSQTGLIARIGKEIASEIVTVLRRIDPTLAPRYKGGFKLGQIKDLSSQTSASQDRGDAVWEINSNTSAQKRDLKSTFEKLATKILERVDDGGS